MMLHLISAFYTIKLELSIHNNPTSASTFSQHRRLTNSLIVPQQVSQTVHPQSTYQKVTHFEINPTTTPLKGILKKTIPIVLAPLRRKERKYKQLRVTFCLKNSNNCHTSCVENCSEDSSTKTFSFDDIQKLKIVWRTPRKSKLSNKKRKKRKYKTVKLQLVGDEDPMVTKTAPGPLSFGLYIFLCIITIGLGILFAGSEWRSVQTRTDLLPLRSNYLAVSCEATDENNGRVVHIDCPLRHLHTFYPPNEFSWNIQPFNGLFFEMKVEMYQWVLKSRWIGVSFGGEWSPNLVDATTYPLIFYNSHINPDFFPHINGAGRRFAPVVYGGSFRLSKKHLFNFHGKRQLTLLDDGYYTPPNERPPTSITYANTQVAHNALYTGNPVKPKIGDLRITFWGSTATHVSAIAQQRYNPTDGEYELVDYQDGSGMNRTIHELVYEGDYSPKAMFHEYIRRREGSKWVLWSIRIGALLLLTTLVSFTYRIFDKSAVAIFPLVVGSALVAVGVTLFSLAPLWLLCDLLKSVLFWIISPIATGLGIFIWSLGRKYTRTSSSDYDEAQDREMGFILKKERFSSPSEHSRHYYRAV